MKFSHLHNHTQYSLLDGASSISKLYDKAIADEMPAIAITDHGNMFGVFDFVAQAHKHKNADGSLKVKPIVGCEFYVVENRHKQKFTGGEKDKRYHQLFLAKNEQGYKNLIKLCSLGFTEGMYSKWPRIDKELIQLHHEGLIATTCCLGAIVPQTFLKHGEEAAEQEFKWWLDLFGDDFFVEFQRHGIGLQDKVNVALQKFANKYNVPIIGSNDSHYVNEEDWVAHDTLLCINTGEKKSTPVADDMDDDEERIGPRTGRFGFKGKEFFFKTTAEMKEVFHDVPEAIDNTNLVIDKIETLSLSKSILLPAFAVPSEFKTQDDYLAFLTWEGAKRRYQVLTPETESRITFELGVIQNMGFAGYFLIVSDFINAGRNMGVFVGPGRGSAAGSVVAYCIGITNIDPIKYNLLFERFLNPDRKSMPDIDTDFDDVGRQKVIDYVAQKYGKNQVAHIVTYGTMAAKMSIKDVARVRDLPLEESNMLAKLVPDKPGISLHRLLTAPLKGENSLASKEDLMPEDIAKVEKLRSDYNNEKSERGIVLREAEKLEGTVRNTGVHAAGIIIAPEDLSNILPVCKAKDTELLVTQFEGNVIEDAGVIKMDFLGLKNLTILKDALALIKQNHGVDIVLDDLPLDDVKTYELYQQGATNGTFQFESPGMQKHLINLKPDRFDDLIAMNALYRPGPLQYIPNFIARKNGREEITYDLPEMEEYLKETYGITVYQEQVMLLSQKLGNFSKGDADVLRKAMGKKQKSVLDKMKAQFVEGCSANGHKVETVEKIWKDWESFAQYAFNKSHSTCYAYVAYHTAYLKAHYPSEYMAAVLNAQGAVEKIAFYMAECKRMKIDVLGPDINESSVGFSVSKNGIVRFGLGAIKGVGEAAVEEIENERKKNGPFEDVFDFVKRVNSRTVNRKCFENLAATGAFDSFEQIHRAQFFAIGKGENLNNLDKILRYGQAVQAQSGKTQASLFGDESAMDIDLPQLAKAEEWSVTEVVEKEKDLLGIYITAHPLDDFKVVFDNLHLSQLEDLKLEENVGKRGRVGCLVTSAQTLTGKTGKQYMRVAILDYSDSLEFMLFGEDVVKFGRYFEVGQKLLLEASFELPEWKKDNRADFKIHGLRLLENASAMFKRAEFLISTPAITAEFVRDLKTYARNNPGNTEMCLEVYDPEMQDLVKLRMSMKVLVTQELVTMLQAHAIVNLQLIT
ncbi:MAG: polymerase subunit alpha [Bacteroidota bacterium]|jgi:DNA polymerase-3 subunit alpha